MALVEGYHRAQQTTLDSEILCQGIMSCLGSSFSSANTTNALPLTIPHSPSETTNVDSFISGILQVNELTKNHFPVVVICFLLIFKFPSPTLLWQDSANRSRSCAVRFCLFQAVTGDDRPLCSSCEEGTSASSRCRDCSEMLCDPCVQAHLRVRITKDHRIVRFTQETNGTTIPDTHNTSSSLGSSSQVINQCCS